MQLSAREIAQLLQGSVDGDPEVKVSRPSKIEEGGAGTLSFLSNEKYEPYLYKTTASIVLVHRDFQPRESVHATLIRVADVYAAVALLFEKFGKQQQNGHPAGISPQAQVHEKAGINPSATVGAFTVISENASIGEGTYIHPQVFLGRNVTIGNNVTLHPGVRILHDCKIGNNCTIHANTVIGSDGFGFAPQSDGTYKKIVHLGNVIIEDDVEIGANTTIDRASMGSTIIRRGAKLDNLIQVGHNVEIGENTVIAAQTGIAGSTRIGRNCRIGGQVGFVGHLRIADGVQVQAQSGVASSVKEATALFGSPAIPYGNYVRAYAVFKQLPELRRQIRELEKQLEKRSQS